MSYLEEVKEQVIQVQEETLERYKQFVDDVCLHQFASSIKAPVAITGRNGIKDYEIDPDTLQLWLKEEGFTVTESGGVISISY